MSLYISDVENDSTAAKEFVRLYARADVLLKGYALVDNTFDVDGKPSNEFRHIFIFPPKLQILKGECVLVYTGTGKYGVRKGDPAKNTVNTHVLYWDSGSPVWNDKEGDRVRLIRFEQISYKDIPAKK